MSVLFRFVRCARCRCRSWLCAAATFGSRGGLARRRLWRAAAAAGFRAGDAARLRGYASRPWLMRATRRRGDARVRQLNLLQGCVARVDAALRRAVLVTAIYSPSTAARRLSSSFFRCSRRLSVSLSKKKLRAQRHWLALRAWQQQRKHSLARSLLHNSRRSGPVSRSITARLAAHRTVSTACTATPSPHGAS